MPNKERLREIKKMLSNEKEKIWLLVELVKIKKLSLLMKNEHEIKKSTAQSKKLCTYNKKID